MAKLIGNLHGRNLYSDKAISSIENLRTVKFVDGSWIDMVSGDKFIRGRDDIVVEPPFSDQLSKQPTHTGPKSFVAKNLVVANVSGCDVIVQPHTENTIVVDMSGKEDMLETINITHEAETVTITRSRSSQQGSSDFHIGDNIISGNLFGASVNIGGMVISGNNVTMMGNNVSINSNKPDVTITIKVPLGTPVNLVDGWRVATIGDTEGDLKASSSSVARINAGRVKNVTIESGGSINVTIDSVNGNITLESGGSCNFVVNGGKAHTVSTIISGAGNVRINAEAENASLIINGAANISLKSCKNRPVRRISGVGNIKVGNW